MQMFLFLFLFFSYFYTVCLYVASAATDCCYQSFFALFYVVVESWYWCIHAIFKAGESASFFYPYNQCLWCKDHCHQFSYPRVHLSILRMILIFLQEYLSFWENFCCRAGFRESLSFVWGTLFIFFFYVYIFDIIIIIIIIASFSHQR